MNSAPQPEEKRHQDNGSSWQYENPWPENGPGLLDYDSINTWTYRDPVEIPRKPSVRCLQAFVEHLKQSKLVQWLVTYLAVAWLTLQLIETLGEIWDIPIPFQRGASLTLALLFFPAGVIAWYHGERGRQRVCAWEIAVVGSLVALAGAAVWQLCLQ